jgi:nitrogenase molybdenum-iron cofactor biosynthesis protein NifN/nitrogenase molybdenum-iron cofactor biosynthesis protein NifE
MSEIDVIQGAERKLLDAIDQIVARDDPPAVFVYATCVPALIGDDIDAVCRVAAERHDRPIVPVTAPGFAGSKNFGNRLAGEALLEHVIGTREPNDASPTDVNLLGEYNVAGELWQVTPLLERLGIRLRACITGGSRFHDIATAHRSRANMLVCSQALLTLARKMEERWGMPWFEGSFYGIADTSKSLRDMARVLVEQGAPADLLERTEALIAEEEAKAWARLEPYRRRLEGKKALLYTGGVKSWSVVAALQEVGLEVVGTSVRKSTDADKQRIADLMGEDAMTFGQLPAAELDAMLRDGRVDVLLSGGRSQFTALKAKVPWVDVNQERHHAFAGYEGMIELVRRIDLELNNPMWAEIRRPAPWAAESPSPQTPLPEGEGLPGRTRVEAGSSVGDGAHPTSLPLGGEVGAAAAAPGEGAAAARPGAATESAQTLVHHTRKPATVNPLAISAPAGAALAFLGIDRALPLFHGGQGCTAFSLVMLVRHFREAIPLQTTAMTEVSTILGGADNIESAIETIYKRAKPDLIGLCSTALTATREDDVAGDLKLMRERREEWADLAIVHSGASDFEGSLQDGWAKAVEALVDTLVEADPGPDPVTSLHPAIRVNILPGSQLTPGDVEAVRDLAEAFGLEVTMLPDLAGSLDGHVPDRHLPHTLGGTPVSAIRTMGRANATLAIGEQMRDAAEAIARRCGVPARILARPIGLAGVDALVAALAEIAGRPVPARIERERSRLIDAMLDGHFFVAGKRIAIAAEPDLLYPLSLTAAELGAEIAAAVSPTTSPVLAEVPAGRVLVGDLDDLERAAEGCDLLIANGHGARVAERLGVPLVRAGLPVFDRLGSAQQVRAGYRGSRDLIFELANALMDHEDGHDRPHLETPAAG